MTSPPRRQWRLAALADRVKDQLRGFSVRLLRLIGIRLLSRDETRQFLQPYVRSKREKQDFRLESVPNGLQRPTLFGVKEAETQESYVWDYAGDEGLIRQLRYGGVRAGNRLLCTDFSHSGFYKGLFLSEKRQALSADLLIAPWSQDLDGIAFGGYYDFVVLVAAKLCRMKDALSEHAFGTATVSYPLFGTPYESDYLRLLGISSTQVFDSRRHRITAKRVVLANSGDWFYPNAEDLLGLKKTIEPLIPTITAESRRIYISRAGRRRVTNEGELMTMLEKFGFTFIADTPRTVAEQVNLYRNADFIIGPHGASFTNVIWCRPGTQLLEIFSPGFMPDFFQYIASVAGLHYAACAFGTAGEHQAVADSLTEDIRVSVHELEEMLSGMLTEVSR